MTLMRHIHVLLVFCEGDNLACQELFEFIVLSRMEKYLYALRMWSRNVHYCKGIHIIPSAREFVRLLPDVVNFALSLAEYEFVIICFLHIIYLSNFTAWLIL